MLCARVLCARCPPLFLLSPLCPFLVAWSASVSVSLPFSRCRKLTQNPYRCTGKSLCARPRCGAVGGLYPPGCTRCGAHQVNLPGGVIHVRAATWLHAPVDVCAHQLACRRTRRQHTCQHVQCRQVLAVRTCLHPGEVLGLALPIPSRVLSQRCARGADALLRGRVRRRAPSF